MERETWGSRIGFVLSTMGFAIGLGAIWRFPYLVGTNGGGAFLLVYIVLTIIIGIPLFVSEVSLGRKSRKSPLLGMQELTKKKGSIWNSFGWLGVVSAVLISAYYAVVIGWILAYIVKMFNGTFTGVSTEAVGTYFNQFIANPVEVLIFTAIIWAGLYLILSKGVQKGVERVCKVLLPMLLVLLIILAIYCLTLPGAVDGLLWFLVPDISAITPEVIAAALSQVFYAAGIGMAASFAYGSYLKEDSSIVGDLSLVVFANIAVSLLVGLIIFPALFSYGISPTAGAGLLFVTLPTVFGEMAFGNIIGGLFFILVLIAAITSIMGTVEAVGSSLCEKFNWGRKKGILITILFLAVLSVPAALSYGIWSNATIFGMGFFDLFDYVSAYITMPLGAIILALYVAFIWKFDSFKDYVNQGAKRIKIQNWMKPLFIAIVPLAVAVVFIAGLIG